MIVVLGSILADEASIDEVLAGALEHVRRSRGEPGCISHDVARDAENPYRLLFTERWASREALQTHFEVPASGAFVEVARRLTGGAVTLDIYPVPD
jgi:quinol monooxygenase YgiN